MAGRTLLTRIFALALAVLILSVLPGVPALAAGEPDFQINMDNLNLTKGVSTTLVISFTNAQGSEIYDIEGIEHFDIISQNQSTSTSIVGGDVSRRLDLFLTIVPKNEGRITLKAIIEFGGRYYETNSLEVTVSETSSGGGAAESDLFVKTVVSHSEAFLGEKIVVTFELYTSKSIENYGFSDYTSIDGMMAKEMPDDQLTAEYIYLDGVRYVKYEVKQLLLDPIRAGEYTIPPFNLQVNVISDPGSNSLFGGFPGFPGMQGGFGGMFGFTTPTYIQTEEKQLIVKPLPSEGKPQNFSGIVGELRLDGYFSREEVNYGDSLSLRATASGNCNLDSLKNIIPGRVQGFSIYETQGNTTEAVEGGVYRVAKEFEAIIVPEQTGTLKVPPISISYFDTVAEEYRTAEIPGATIAVKGEMAQQHSGSEARSGAFDTVTIKQVSYAGADDGYFSLQIKKGHAYGALIALGALAILAAVLLRVLRKKKQQDQTLKALFKELMGAGDVSEAYGVFCAMIKHRYNVSLKACSLTTVQSSLPDAELAEQVADIMRYMESGKPQEEKECAWLKSKAKEVYKMSITLPR